MPKKLEQDVDTVSIGFRAPKPLIERLNRQVDTIKAKGYPVNQSDLIRSIIEYCEPHALTIFLKQRWKEDSLK